MTFVLKYVTLVHKTSLKQHMIICSNNQQYMVKIIYLFFFYAKNH